MSDREEIMNLIRNEYDPRPDLGRANYPALDWDDGAGRIADAILADRALLLRKHAEEIARLRDVAATAKADASGTEHPMNKVQPSCPCGTSEEECPNADGDPLCAQPQADGMREAQIYTAELHLNGKYTWCIVKALPRVETVIEEFGYGPDAYKTAQERLAALASEGKPSVPQTPWMPIETIPEDRPIQAWHITWKCPVTIQKRSWGDRSAWVEKTLTTEWPLAAFSHWMEVAASPLSRPDRECK